MDYRPYSTRAPSLGTVIERLYRNSTLSEAIDRIVARNAFLFELRNRPEAPDIRSRLEAIDWTSLKQLATRPVCRELSRIRSSNRRAVLPDLQPDGRTDAVYIRPAAVDGRPLVLVVSPFHVLPPRHGGAWRIWHMCEALSARWRFALLSDEITGTTRPLGSNRIRSSQCILWVGVQTVRQTGLVEFGRTPIRTSRGNSTSRCTPCIPISSSSSISRCRG